MLKSLTKKVIDLSDRFVPDPFTIAIILTFLVFALAQLFGQANLNQNLEGWQNGFFSLLEFSMQMTLILLTGYAIAHSRPVQYFQLKLAHKISSPTKAILTVSILSMGFGLIHWGLGLIIGALLARNIALHLHHIGVRIHYPLLGACGYLGLLVWHGGLSGSAPLSVATPNHFLIEEIDLIGVHLTLFSNLNIIMNLLLLTIIPLLLIKLHPREHEIKSIIDYHPHLENREHLEAPSGLEKSHFLISLLGFFGFIISGAYFYNKGLQGLNLNSMIWLFFFLGLLLHQNLNHYLEIMTNGVKACLGIILQFPLYGGIMGLMKSSGLIVLMSSFFQKIATPQTLPLFIYISAALVNLVVPSGGGQWAVQGPIAMDATIEIGGDIAKNIMALCYGDQLTNMLQPFWALPLLGITGLKAKDLIGYTFLVMLAALIIQIPLIYFL